MAAIDGSQRPSCKPPADVLVHVLNRRKNVSSLDEAVGWVTTFELKTIVSTISAESSQSSRPRGPGFKSGPPTSLCIHALQDGGT